MLFHRNDYNCKPFYEDCLYEKCQKVRYNVGGREEEPTLTVKVSTTTRTGLTDEKLLRVTLTDERNPLLLYQTEIDSEIYAKLKQKLGLLIDFSQFPTQLVSLLTQCTANEHTSKYALTLEDVKTDPYDIVDGRCILFRVLEVNKFQRLCLVALHMAPGSESEVNALMARNVTSLRKHIDVLEGKVRETEERCFRAEECVKTKGYEMEQIRAQLKDQLRVGKQQSDNELEMMRQNYEALKHDCERRIKKALADHDEKHRLLTAGLEEDVQKNRAEASVLRNLKTKLEMEVTERDEKLEKFRGDVKILQDEILKLEGKMSRMEAEAKEKNAFIVNLKQRFAYLEKERDEREKTVKKLTSLLEASESSKNYLKAAVKEKAEGCEKKERELSTLSRDLSKANEIITKMNKEIATVKTKLNERLKVMMEQEKVIAEFKDKLSGGDKTVEEKCDRIRELEEENARLRNSLACTEEELKAKEETIRKNERIIGWLNDIVGKQDSSRPQSSSSRGASTVSSAVDSVISKTNSIDRKYLQTSSGSDVMKSSTNTRLCRVNKPVVNAMKK